MPEGEQKQFDVSRPQQVGPSASSRPIIVGHRPTMSDPMLRGTARPMVHDPAPGLSPEQLATNPSVPQPAAINTAFSEPTQQGPVTDSALQSVSTPPLPIDGHTNDGAKKSLWWIVLAVLSVLIGVYLIIDSGLIKTSIDLPFHIFKQNKVNNNNTNSSPPVSTSTPPPATQTTIPTGFNQYKDSSIPFTFDYPTTWGLPTAVPEPGYSKRGGTNKADGTYAVTITFATNKDVQIVATSGKYLPAARASFYYDFGQWCIGSSDSKIYKSLLRFTTTAGVDTATTMVCDQGPMTDASKLTTAIVTQPKVKDSAGKLLGDIYTANLDSPVYPVVRVKDAVSTNSTNIKTLLSKIH